MDIKLSTKKINVGEKGTAIFEAVAAENDTDTRTTSPLYPNFDGNANDLLNFQSRTRGKSIGEVWYWGSSNDLPQELLKIIVDNSITPGLLNFKSQVALSKGLYFYKNKIVEEAGKVKKIKVPVLDLEIEEWLEEIEAEEYLKAAVMDATFFANTFTQIVTDKARNKVKYLNRLESSLCRLEYPDKENIYLYEHWTDVGIGTAGKKTILEKYDKSKNQKNFVVHARNYFPGYLHYGFAPWSASLNWLKFANEIPVWKYWSIKNGMSLKYHIEYPEDYYITTYSDDQINPETGNPFSDVDRAKKQKDLEAAIESWLTGPQNAQKTFISRFKNSEFDGRKLESWKINVIDDKQKYDAYIDDFNTSNQAVTSAHNIDPSIASINTQGQLSSGSDKKHSYNIMTNIVVNEIREMLLRPLNIAKKIQFPDKKNIKLGFENIYLVDASVTKNSIVEEQNNNKE